MSHLLYLVVLLGCLASTFILEALLGVRVYARWPRLLLTLLPVVVLFTAWDEFAIAAGQWRYVRHWTTGVLLPGHLPIEELAFFVVIPTCAIATLEAVRRRRPQWVIGDES